MSAVLRALAADHATFSTKFAKLKVDEIREVARAVGEVSPEELEEWRAPRNAVLVRTLLSGDDDLKRGWADLLAVLAIRTRRSHTKALKAALEFELAALAKKPRVVEAIRAAVVSDQRWDQFTRGLELLPVLGIDGSEASVDALMTVFDAAMHEDQLLDDRDALLEVLSTMKSKTGAMQTLHAAIARTREGRDEVKRTSPAIVLAESLGLGKRTEFTFDCRQASTLLASDGTRAVNVRVRFASQDDGGVWFSVNVSFRDTITVGDFKRFRYRVTEFESPAVMRKDELELGAFTEVAQVPTWLRSIGPKLGVTLETQELKSSVRGSKNQARLAAWLAG